MVHISQVIKVQKLGLSKNKGGKKKKKKESQRIKRPISKRKETCEKPSSIKGLEPVS